MVLSRIVPNEPALILDNEKKYLVVTDLHLGFESTFAAKKVFLGKFTTTKEISTNLQIIAHKSQVDSIVLLGDIKSSIKSISKNEWDEIPEFFEMIGKNYEIILIPGNHDANIQRLIPKNVIMTGPTGMILDDILLTHGHVMPSNNFSSINKIVMGHIHPVFFQENSVVNGLRVWISIRTQKQFVFPQRKGELDITIVPSFNRYFYASHKNRYKKSISPIIEKIKDISAAKILTLDGTIIGDKETLKQII